jgi:DNA-binding transcriptional LysR family regulator
MLISIRECCSSVEQGLWSGTDRVWRSRVGSTVELRHLRYFIAVAEELNFSRAARRLQMAQPPLSVAIRQLEQEIGAQLFTRTSREVRLTEAGEALLAGARRTLAEADAAVTSAQRAAEGKEGTLRIGYSWSARFEIVPAVGSAYSARFPDVELVAEELWNARVVEALRAGAIDVAISLCPEVAGELSREPVRLEAVIALLGSSHPLAGAESLELAALAEEEFLIFPRELAPRLYDFQLALCRGAGFEPRHSADSFHTRWTMRTWKGTEVALVPASVAAELPDGVAAVRVASPPDPIETDVVWRTGDDRPAVTAFVEAARGAFA